MVVADVARGDGGDYSACHVIDIEESTDDEEESIKALENKSTSNGVQVIKGVKVNGFKRGSNSNAITGA